MNLKEWRRKAELRGIEMEWAIFNHKWNDANDPYDEWILDFDALSLSDGIYRCIYGYENQTEGPCVFVKNMYFQSFKTAKALYDLVWPIEGIKKGDPVSHKFIEKLEWLPEEVSFRLYAGS